MTAYLTGHDDAYSSALGARPSAPTRDSNGPPRRPPAPPSGWGSISQPRERWAAPAAGSPVRSAWLSTGSGGTASRHRAICGLPVALREETAGNCMAVCRISAEAAEVGERFGLFLGLARSCSAAAGPRAPQAGEVRGGHPTARRGLPWPRVTRYLSSPGAGVIAACHPRPPGGLRAVARPGVDCCPYTMVREST